MVVLFFKDELLDIIKVEISNFACFAKSIYLHKLQC